MSDGEIVELTPHQRAFRRSEGPGEETDRDRDERDHWRGVIDFDDLEWRRCPYSRAKAYCYQQAGQPAVHAGVAAAPGPGGALARLLSSPVDSGVRPQLWAATDPEARKLDFYGPRFGLRGALRRLPMRGEAGSDALARRLWEVTEEVTGLRYDTPPAR